MCKIIDQNIKKCLFDSLDFEKFPREHAPGPPRKARALPSQWSLRDHSLNHITSQLSRLQISKSWQVCMWIDVGADLYWFDRNNWPLTSRDITFCKCLRWSSRKAVSVPVIGGLRGSTATSSLVPLKETSGYWHVLMWLQVFSFFTIFLLVFTRIDLNVLMRIIAIGGHFSQNALRSVLNPSHRWYHADPAKSSGAKRKRKC